MAHPEELSPGNTGAGPILMGTGQITPEMNSLLNKLVGFQGTKEEAGEFLDSAVLDLVGLAFMSMSSEKRDAFP